jgi:ABC-type branched-subunit amino acid transport system ATPase component
VRSTFATPLARADEAELRRIARSALDEVGLAWAAELSAAELSGPEQRLLGVAAALASSPRVLLLDEPSAGSSLEDVQMLARVVSGLSERGVAVLLVEHNLRLVRSVADRVVVMAAGSVIASGRPAAVATDPDVRAAYLGTAAL